MEEELGKNTIKLHCIKFSNFILVKKRNPFRIINLKCNKYVLKTNVGMDVEK